MAPKPQKHISEKENLQSEALMNQLFEEAEDKTGDNFHSNGMIAENREIIEEIYDNLEDELDALEEKHQDDAVVPDKTASRGTPMDIEKPYKPVYQEKSLYKPSKPLYEPSKPAATTSQTPAMLGSFIPSLYTRQKERTTEKAFKFSSPDLDSIDEKKYDLDLHDRKAQFYLIDVQENFSDKSTALVYGKVKVKGSDPVSCCLAVKNMERCYYFFKRENDQVVIYNLN